MTADRPRRAVVTGAASGIGRAVARALTAANLQVIGVDRDPIPDELWATQIADLGDEAGLAALCAELQRHQPVDILVNVAGILSLNPANAFDAAGFWQTLKVNLYAPVMLVTTLGPAMCDRGWGRVVNVSSVHAIVSEPETLAYDASKTALVGITRTLAVEWARSNVLVNAVAPGFTATGMSVVNGENELESDWFRQIYIDGGQLPIGRAADPAEIAALIAWLVSAQNTYVTGATLVADGGMTVRM